MGLSPKAIIEKGVSMSFIPEDRLGMGLVPSMSITDNMMLKTFGDRKFHIPAIKPRENDDDFEKIIKKTINGVSGWINGLCPFVDRKEARRRAKQLIERLEISTPSSETPVRQLSGGNVQKVLVGREIESSPNVIVTAYPVRGLDINSSYRIYDLLNEQKKKGVAVIFIGEDLDVLMQLSDRIMVMCGGKVSGIVDPRKVTKEDIGLMMIHTDHPFVKDKEEGGKGEVTA